MTSPAVRGWLEALGLEPRLPDGRFLEDLFLRFQRRVACESLTRPPAEASTFDAEGFAAEWPDEERGLTGGERALAFAWLAGEIGFRCEVVESICSRPWEVAERDGMRRGERQAGSPSNVMEPSAHRSVVAHVEGQPMLADAGFPLPVLLPLGPAFEEVPSSFGPLSVAEAEGWWHLLCDARGDVKTLLSLPLGEIRSSTADAQPQHDAGGAAVRGSTPRASAPSAPFALRVLDDRVLHWRDGLVTILDAWSVLTYPLAGTDRSALESLFALSLEGVDLPEVPAADAPATLAVFHALAAPPEEARRDLVLTDPPESLVASRTVEVVPAPAGSRLVSRAVLAGRVPPAGPGESVRRTLVFHLAMELLGAGGAGGAR